MNCKVIKVPRKISSDPNNYILTVVKSEIIMNKIDYITRTVLSISSEAEVIFKRAGNKRKEKQ